MLVTTLWANVVNVVMGIVIIYRSMEVVGIARTTLTLSYQTASDSSCTLGTLAPPWG